MTDAFPIEANVPIPPAKRGGPRGSKYPFAEMDVGDSFHVSGASLMTIRSALGAARKRYPGTAWTAREMDGGCRVWRLG